MFSRRVLTIAGVALLLWLRPWRYLRRFLAAGSEGGPDPAAFGSGASGSLYAPADTGNTRNFSGDVARSADTASSTAAQTAKDTNGSSAATADLDQAPMREAFAPNIGTVDENAPSDMTDAAPPAASLFETSDESVTTAATDEALIETSSETPLEEVDETPQGEAEPLPIDTPPDNGPSEAPNELPPVEESDEAPRDETPLEEVDETPQGEAEPLPIDTPPDDATDEASQETTDLSEIPHSEREIVAAPAPAVTPASPSDEEASEAPPAQPDNLLLIEGIGPRTSTVVTAAGITSFAQLAAADVDQLRTMLRDAGLRTIDPSTWPEQARIAAEGDLEALRDFQGRIKNGRLQS